MPIPPPRFTAKFTFKLYSSVRIILTLPQFPSHTEASAIYTMKRVGRTRDFLGREADRR